MRSRFGFTVSGASSHVAVALLMVGIAVSLGGCAKTGPQPVPVKGTVVFRGKPLAKARVTFFKEGASLPATGDTNDSGEFVLTMIKDRDGALVGENTVTVVMLPGAGAEPMMPPDPAKMASGQISAMPKAKVVRTTVSNIVPGLYGDMKNTPLRWTVKPEGESNAKIELK